MSEKLCFNTKDDLLTVLNWLDNKELKEAVRIVFMLGDEKYMILVPSYGMVWRLFDYPYKNDRENHRRIMTQKTSIIAFIEDN